MLQQINFQLKSPCFYSPKFKSLNNCQILPSCMTQHKTVEYLYFSNLQINFKCFGRINFTCINLQNIQAASLSTYKKQNSLQFQSREFNFITNFITKKNTDSSCWGTNIYANTRNTK